MTTINHIVFDIGHVLIHWDPEIPYRRLIPDEDKRQWFLSEVCNGAWNVEQDRGRSWQEAEEILIDQHPGEEELIRAYRQCWMEMVPHAKDHSVALMLNLVDSGRDVTLLTNWNQDTFSEAEKMYPFLSATRGVTVSGRVGLIKPDPEIFQHHQGAFDLGPEATLFIDDNQNNVDAARAFGWQALHYTDELDLEASLRELDLV